jgi:N-acetylglucosamine transport system substrate-binding protein
MNTDQLVVWNSFLSGQTDVGGLTKGLQDITDKIANDSSVKKLKIT